MHEHTRRHVDTDTNTNSHTHTQKHSVAHPRRSEKKKETTDNHNHKKQPCTPAEIQAHIHTQQRVCHMSVPSSSNNLADICATRSLFHCHNVYALLSSNVSKHRVDPSRLPQNYGVTHRKIGRPIRPQLQVVQPWIGRALSWTTTD